MHVTVPASDEDATKSWAQALEDIQPDLAAENRSKGGALRGPYLDRGGVYDLQAGAMIVGYDRHPDRSATVRLWQVTDPGPDGEPLREVKVWTTKTGRIGPQILAGLISRYRKARPPAPAPTTVRPGPARANQRDDTCCLCHQLVPAGQGILVRSYPSERPRVQHSGSCPPRPPRLNEFPGRCTRCGGDVAPGAGHLSGDYETGYRVRHSEACPPRTSPAAPAPRRNARPDRCVRCLQDVAAGAGLLRGGPSAWTVVHAKVCPPHPLNPDGAPTWTVTSSDAHGGDAEGAAEGTVARVELWAEDPPEHAPGLTRRDQKRVSFIGVALACWQRRSYDIDDQEWVTVVSTIWRAATDAEAGDVLAAEDRARRRRALADRVRHQFAVSRFGTARDGTQDGVRPRLEEIDPARIQALPLVPLPTGCGSPPPYEPQVRLDEADAMVWAIAHNGLDGDDWSVNNYGGSIATRHPLTSERRQLIADLRAELELETWTRHDVDVSAAQILIASGWGIDAAHRVAAFEITAEADAHTLLRVGITRWQQAGWWNRSASSLAPRFTPADAERLAAAGISYTTACQLHRAGITTTTAMLEAEPPAISDEATRIIIRPPRSGAGRKAQVTTDVQLARDWLRSSHDQWDPALIHADAGPRPVHVAPTWSLWDDGSLVVRSRWMSLYQPGEPDRQAPRPAGLSPAAVEALTLVAEAVDGDCGDRAVWHPLREATAITRTTIATTGTERYRSGSAYALDRVNVATPGGTTTLWQVTTEWWSMGEDGDADSYYTLHTDEATARSRYRKASATS